MLNSKFLGWTFPPLHFTFWWVFFLFVVFVLFFFFFFPAPLLLLAGGRLLNIGTKPNRVCSPLFLRFFARRPFFPRRWAAIISSQHSTSVRIFSPSSPEPKLCATSSAFPCSFSRLSDPHHDSLGYSKGDLLPVWTLFPPRAEFLPPQSSFSRFS